MSKYQPHKLLIAIAPCLGWLLVQPVLAADTRTASTFKETFAAASKAGNETFEWNGKKYSAVKKTPTKPITKVTPKDSGKNEVKAAVTVTPAVSVVTPLPASPVNAPVATAPTPSAAPNSVSSIPPIPPFVFAPVSISPSAPGFVANTPTPWSPRPNPYIVQPVTVTIVPAPAAFPWQNQSIAQAPATTTTPIPTVTPTAPFQETSGSKDSGKSRSLLPTFTKVYPTGEKPMVVVTFSCPTELAGINTPSTKILHSIFDLGFGAVNATNLLPWTLQQVCS